MIFKKNYVKFILKNQISTKSYGVQANSTLNLGFREQSTLNLGFGEQK